MKRLFTLGLVILIISACTTSKRVTYQEMRNHPTVQISDDSKIIVQTANSDLNSSLFITKIKSEIDTINKEINLSGYQSIWKLHNNRFEIKIKKQSKSQLDKYRYFWIDPDNNKIMIDKIK